MSTSKLQRSLRQRLLGDWLGGRKRPRLCKARVRGRAAHGQASCRSSGAGYDEAERFVSERPGESMLVCFGVGLIVGAVVVLSSRFR